MPAAFSAIHKAKSIDVDRPKRDDPSDISNSKTRVLVDLTKVISNGVNESQFLDVPQLPSVKINGHLGPVVEGSIVFVLFRGRVDRSDLVNVIMLS